MTTAPERISLSPRICNAREHVYLNPQRRHITQTDITRGEPAQHVLDEYVLPELDHPVNILLVGVGLEETPFPICYEPFTIAAHVEGRGIQDYAMTLVDIDGQALRDVATRTQLYLQSRLIVTPGPFQAAWIKYVRDTGQEMRTAPTEVAAQLVLSPHPEDTILVANVSPLFRSKLASGEVTLIEADIATADLGGVGKFDFVDCTNVLYQLSGPAQQAAIANMVDALRVGGYLLVNDLAHSGNPVTKDLGGWINEGVLDEFRLEQVKILHQDENSRTIVYRKILPPNEIA